MNEQTTDAGAPMTGSSTPNFDDEDDLLERLVELCSPEQQRRGTSPREVLAKLAPAERAELLDRLAPALREELRRLIGR
jgi:hypothetical protein